MVDERWLGNVNLAALLRRLEDSVIGVSIHGNIAVEMRGAQSTLELELIASLVSVAPPPHTT